MMRASSALFSLAVVAVAACAAYSEPRDVATYDLEFCVAEDMISDELGYGVGSGSTVTPAPVAGGRVRAEPQFASDEPFRGYVIIQGSGKTTMVLAALDASRGGGPPYDRLYVDANGDRDLRNDPVIKATKLVTKDSGYIYSYFRPVMLKLPPEGGRSYAVAIYSYYLEHCPNHPEGHSYVRARSACYYEGRARFGDEERRVVLMDRDCNGLFNERNPANLSSPTSSGGDEILILPDADEPVELTGGLLSQAIPLGRYVGVGDRFYQIRPATDGSSVQVHNRHVPTGPLHVEANGEYRLRFGSEDGPVVVQSRGPEARLPIGTYTLGKQAIVATDIEGRVWVVETYPSLRPTTRVLTPVGFSLPGGGTARRTAPAEPARSTANDLAVTADSGPTIPAFGPPLVLDVTASVRDEEVSIGLSVTGERGDRIRSVLVDGSTPPAPVFQILSAGGKVIAEDQFEYG
ncbi:MAG: hypothetical protein PVJ27_01470 [Candidatus Brocadiaceae bacterium]|jgi:hypothetical protein